MDRLGNWSERNHMKINKRKWKVLHLGKNNPMHLCRLGTLQRRTWGILEDIKLAKSQQCSLTRKTNSSILSCIRKTIVSRSRKVIFPLYSTVVRSHLECCAQFWPPQHKKDRDLLEWLQEGAQRWLRDWSTSHVREDRELGMFILFIPENKRLRGNPINV